MHPTGCSGAHTLVLRVAAASVSDHEQGIAGRCRRHDLYVLLYTSNICSTLTVSATTQSRARKDLQRSLSNCKPLVTIDHMSGGGIGQNELLTFVGSLESGLEMHPMFSLVPYIFQNRSRRQNRRRRLQCVFIEQHTLF